MKYMARKWSSAGLSVDPISADGSKPRIVYLGAFGMHHSLTSIDVALQMVGDSVTGIIEFQM